MNSVLQDVRYAFRSLVRSPGFTLAAVLTLAVGVGANTAVFSVVRGVLLRPLPYAEAHRLVSVVEEHAQEDVRLASYPTFEDWRRQSRVFDGLAFIRGLTVNFRSAEGPEQLIAGYVSPDFFRVVGASPVLGRRFSLDEQQSGGADVAVISHTLWRRRFGGKNAIGRTMAVADRTVTIVGVMPLGFSYPDWAALWMPITALPVAERAMLAERGLHVDSRVIGRLRAGLDLERARAEMNTLAERLAAAYPAESKGWTRVQLAPLAGEILGDTRSRLLILQATVLLVLLIGCANLANLSLARGSARARELAVRAALGASRRRLTQQLLVESSVLAAAGAVAGVLLAIWAVAALRSSAPDVVPRLGEVTVDWLVLGFTFLLSAAAAAAFGLLPTLRVSRPDLTASLTDGGAQAGVGARGSGTRGFLIVAEVALAMILLVGAGLLLKSFARLQQVQVGFETDRLLTLRVMPPSPRFDEPEQALALYQRLQETVAAVPGVEAVALTNHMPLTGASILTQVMVEGRPPEGRNETAALFRTISPEYFDTMQIALLSGRGLTTADLTSTSPSVVVNEAFVRSFWPGVDPIGRQLTVFKSVQRRADFGEPLTGTVVGVASNVHHFDQETDPVPEVYLPYPRNPPRWISLVVRTRLEPDLMVAPLRRAVLSVDPDLPVVGEDLFAGFATVEEYLAEGRAPRTLTTILLAVFAAIALLLAMIGLYGVVAYLVVLRQRELALRMALGAQRADVLKLVLGRTMLLCLVGLALGALGALLLTRFMASLLFDVAHTDLATYAVGALALVGVTLAASYIPALRATRVDPVIALRSE
ncbi:MAG: ABC transporter permease [Gemmatimonadota bacterium]|nr:ABC transporter permease [Gemmatimonadota bacterium]